MIIHPPMRPMTTRTLTHPVTTIPLMFPSSIYLHSHPTSTGTFMCTSTTGRLMCDMIPLYPTPTVTTHLHAITFISQ